MQPSDQSKNIQPRKKTKPSFEFAMSAILAFCITGGIVTFGIWSSWSGLNEVTQRDGKYRAIVHQHVVVHSEKSPELKWAIEAYQACVYQEKPTSLFEKLWEVCRQPILLRAELRGVGSGVDAAIVAFHASVAESIKREGLSK